MIGNDQMIMDSILSPEMRAIAPVYLATAVVLVLALFVGRSKSAAVKSARVRLPVIFFGIFSLIAGSYGIYQIFLCLRDILAQNLTAWNEFLEAELALLFAWRLLGWTALSLLILRGGISNEKVTLKRGTVGRVLFMVATGTACLGYIMAKMFFAFFGMPLLFIHLGHAVIAVLMFCTFTYPWSRHRQGPPVAASEPN